MSKETTRRTASEVWAALEEQAIDEEIEVVLAMSPEERRRELLEAGFDLDEVHAKADALGAELARPQAVAAPVAVLRPKRRMAVIVSLAAALAAGVALVVHSSSQPNIVGQGLGDGPAVRAAELRREARDACGARSWPTCLDKLNQARALDPSGDEAPEIQSLRRAAADPGARP